MRLSSYQKQQVNPSELLLDFIENIVTYVFNNFLGNYNCSRWQLQNKRPKGQNVRQILTADLLWL